MEPSTPPKDIERGRFAAQLESKREQVACTRLVLVAPQAFPGQLRGALSDQVTTLVAVELNKDLVQLSAGEI